MIKTLSRFLLLGLLAIQACSAAAYQPEKPAINVTGTWRGTSTTYCGMMLLEKGRCGAVQRISFTLFQDGADVKGTYRCAVGNMVCRGMDDSGPVVSSSVSGTLARLRVMLTTDGSSCIFDGHFKGESADGNFFCYQGGGLVEEGQWKLARWY
ncbi:MAG TPA: hypothetical protein VGY99_28880 [Candidatus Binataceae bacterium]|jgi:hypothetical protein|nr:hypothetical protein [Candidatus Binataceae bacterium]